jgi:hypothetical protein
MTKLKSTNFSLFSSCSLHLLAMAFMLSDHLWATLFPYLDILTCIGRVAFPIFAFMIVEGYFYTHDLKKYICRLFLFALLSEIPFDLVAGGTIFYPFHQNVLWTYLIGLLLISWIERVKKLGKPWLNLLIMVGALILGYILGTITIVDFYGAGVLTILVFYLFRGRKLWHFAAQAACLCYINMHLLSGFCYPISILGHAWDFPQQGLAVLALIPIWLYNGRQGYHEKWFRVVCYAFYPVHLLILYVLWQMAT